MSTPSQQNPCDGRPPISVSVVERHCGLIVVLATALLCLPFVRSVWWLADEGVWLHAAQRMLDGQVLYLDFFQFHPPLGFFIVKGWMGAFGPSLIAARLLIVLVIATTAWLAFACCRIISNRPGLSALLTLSWVVAAQGPWTQVSHHWLTSLFSMIALWGILSAAGKSRRVAMSGLAASAATLVTTHRGCLIVLAGLAALLMRRSPKALLIYIGSGLALLVAVICILWAQGSLEPAFDQVVLYTLRHYSDVQAVPFGAFSDLQTMLVVSIFPLTACLMVFGLLRHRGELLRHPHFGVATTFASAGFIGCFPRPDAVHIAFNAVLAVPLLAKLLDVILGKLPASPILKNVAIAIALIPSYPFLISAFKVSNATHVETSAGRVAMMSANGSSELLKQLKTLPPGDKVYFYPYDPMLPYLTGLSHPARFDILVPEYSPASQYKETCLQVMRRAQWVVFDHEVSRPSFYRAVFPAMRNPSPPEKIRFEVALKSGFAHDSQYGHFQILRRAEAAEILCNDVDNPRTS